MKVKPIITDKIQTRHTNYIVDLQLDSNITFVTGDSGEGKSLLYSLIKEYSSIDTRIKCFNYLDFNSGFKTAIRRSKEKLFVIDNADILLDDSMRRHIATDTNNQYIIISRNPSGLLLTQNDINELESNTDNGITTLKLKKMFR